MDITLASGTPSPALKPGTPGQQRLRWDLSPLAAGTVAGGDVEIAAIQASVDRLRSQRHVVERIKLDVQRKDTRIHLLTAEVAELHGRLRTFQQLAADFTAVQARLSTAEASVDLVRREAAKRESELATQLSEARGAETSLRGAVGRLEQRLTEERQRSSNEAGDLRGKLGSAIAERETQARQAAQLRSENSELRERRLEAERTAQAQGSRASSELTELNQRLARLAFERGELEEKNRSLTLVVDKQRELLQRKERAAASEDQRVVLLSSTVKELEETTTLLRSQLVEAEERSVKREEDLRRELAEAKALSHKTERSVTSQQEVLRETERAHASARACLQRREAELAQHVESLSHAKSRELSASQRIEGLGNRCAELERQLAAEHQRSAELAVQLEAERSERGEWARARLELLTQFCEEEGKLRSTLEDDGDAWAPELPVVGAVGGEHDGREQLTTPPTKMVASALRGSRSAPPARSARRAQHRSAFFAAAAAAAAESTAI